ncbi:flagellar export chaperone FlgN [Nocardioides zeae]|uniref:Flagellar export chaperone FlgN n=1 Tax=Nocardioides imazamoxiresistens TaxID=3231893 RepID=A0ABU3PY12_9ACTN|nr:flagellar export chaperone FlgN [Nocardioides zeae]MDT9594133.1 flagellar export chaperone FlgN [Nocardioides zeae]
MEKLSLVLWRERELLDSLLYRLELEHLVLAGGRGRWLARAAQDVTTALEALRETELLRAVVADETAADLGVPAAASLETLALAVDDPWREMLLEHRGALLDLAREITDLADANRGLVASGHRSVRETLRSLDGAEPAYGQGASADLDDGSIFDDGAERDGLALQEIAYRAALADAVRVVQPSLLDFLR